MRALNDYFETCFHPPHLARTLSITLVVGTWLTLFNHGAALIAQHPDPVLGAKIFLNYVTPFVVANWGLVSRQPADE